MSNTSEKNIFASDIKIKLVDLTGLEKYHEKLKSKFIVNDADDTSTVLINRQYDENGSVDITVSDNVDGGVGASIIVNDADNVTHNGLTINNGYTKLVGETQTGSSETSGGSIVLSKDGVEIEAWKEDPETGIYSNDSLSFNENGLKLNGSDVITTQNAYANGVLLVNSQNVSTRNELTVGGFEIKNVAPYSYTIEASFGPEDPGYFHDEFNSCDECIITAEWDKNEPVIIDCNMINPNVYGDIYAYKFIITGARVYGELIDVEGSDYQWYDYQKPVNTEVFIPAGYLDEEYRDIEKDIHPIEFIDGQCSLPDTIYIDYTDKLCDITVTQYAPMSLRHTSKAVLNGVEVATVDDIQNITVDTKLDINSNNPIANSAVANAISGGVHFIGTTDQLPWDGIQNTTIGRSLSGSSTQEYTVGDIIIVASGGAEQSFDEPTKEYILAYGNVFDTDDEGMINGYRWVELGDVTPAVDTIKEYISNYYTKTESDNRFVKKSDIPGTPIVKGTADNSAVLDGEYNNYSNKAISQVSMAIGAASTAGLKGYYYKAIDFANNKIYLSASQPNSIKTSGFSAESITCDYSVGDYISIVADSKFENCSKITAKGSGVITVDSLPFTADSLPSYTLGIGKQPDDFTLYSANRSISSLTNAMSVKNYNKGTVDMGGGALAEGVQTFATNIGAHAEGIQTHAYGQYSHTEGFRTQAGYAAHAEGRETIASGSRSHAEGQNTVASGNMSHAQGIDTIASGGRSFATGNGTIAEGAQSITGGYKSKSTGDSAVSIGHKTYAKGQDSICVGSGNNEVTAYESKTNEEILAGVKDGSIVASMALGKQSQSFGGNTFAYGDQSFASGWRTKAIGNHSHAEGNYSIAEGNNSFAGGNYTEANGAASFAAGDHTKTTSTAEAAFGKYNNSTTNTLFSVGNGTSETARNNAFELVVSDETIPAHWNIQKWPDKIVIQFELSRNTSYPDLDAYLTCYHQKSGTTDIYALESVEVKFSEVYDGDSMSSPAFSKIYTTNEVNLLSGYYDWSQTSSYCRAAQSVLGLIFNHFTDVNGNGLDYDTGLSIVGNENTPLHNFKFKLRVRTIDEFTDGDHVNIEGFKNSPFAYDISYNIFEINNTTYKYALNTYDEVETYGNLLWSYNNAQAVFVDEIEAGVIGYINGKKIATNDENDFDTSKLEAAIQTNANNIDNLSTEINTIKTDIDNVENDISNIPIQTYAGGGVIMVNAGGANTATGSGSFAIGKSTIASGVQSVAGGYKSKTAGDSSVSIGHKTYAKGQDSICIGTGNNEVTAYESKTNEEILAGVKDGSIVASIALGSQSQAFGGNVFAYGSQAHAEGWRTKAIGNHSHAEGNYSIAEGNNSFAGGNYTEANGAASFATGDHTKATNDNEAAFGKYNKSNTDTVFSIGGGTSEKTRKNLFEVKSSDTSCYAYVNDEIIATRAWVEANSSADVEIASIDEIDALLESLNLVVENNDPSAPVDSI